MELILWVLIAVVVLLILYAIVIYNRLVGLRQGVRNSWSQIDVQLKRRYDLIPNLIETVKGYAAHERETFQRVTEARQLAIDAKSVREQGQAENMLTSTLRSLFAVSEAYPDLKANQNFLQLQEELAGTENKIAYSRQHYNDVVAVFNTTCQAFPSNVIASMGGFAMEDFFEMEDTAQREPPKVSFKPETPQGGS